MRKNIGPQKLLSDIFSVSSLLVPNSLVAPSLMNSWSLEDAHAYLHTQGFFYNVSMEETVRIRAMQQNGRDLEICI